MKHRFTLALTALLCMFGAIRAQVPFTQEDGYYLINSAEDLVQLSTLSNDVTTRDNVWTAKFKVTQDIDMSSIENFTPIAYASGNGASFKGVFDGQGHTISNLTITTSETNSNHVGFIGLLYTGTLCNLCLRNVTINNNSTSPVARGALVGRDGSGTIENCCVVNFTMNDQTISETSTSAPGAVVGYLSSSETSVFRNNYAFHATRSVNGTNMALFSFGGKGKNAVMVTNNYDDTNANADVFASGEVCYLLNGSQSDSPVWYQTIGEDASPVLDATHKTVYVSNDMTCDGKPKGDLTYGNAGVGKRDDHAFVDGICSLCGNADETWLLPVDGVYPIGTPEQLKWYAALVNSGNTQAKGCLTADINMDGKCDNFSPIGTEGHPFNATFDGQGHRISHLVVEQETNCAGLFGYIQAPCTIQNLTLDETCSITGAAYSGLIGESVAVAGEIYMTNLGNEGIVTCSGVNAGGIIGCCMSSSATFIITNCYVTGNVTGGSESGQLSGWLGSNATVSNCWATATAQGVDSDERYFARYGGATFKNCYSAFGNQVPLIGEEQLASGELTWLLNGQTFLNPGWFQTIGSDPVPVLDATHGVVYKSGGSYINIESGDSFSTFRANVVAEETYFCEETIATQSLIDAYKAAIDTWNDIATFDEFMVAYGEAKPLRDAVVTSASEYQSYMQACQDAREQLKSVEQENNARIFLEDYLDAESEIEPGDYPHGNSTYILNTHTLTGAELQAEKAYLEKLILRVVLSNPSAGSEMTFVMNNPDFTAAFNGWTVEGTAEMYHGGELDVMHTARGMNGPFIMKQTLQDLPNGIYELRLNAFTRTAGDVSTKLYTADLFMNDVANNIMAIGEDAVSEADAQDGVNCHITGSSVDVTYYDEMSDVNGYVPGYLVGCSYAFKADRYLNRVAVEVTDGTLTLGVNDHASSLGNWTTFANARLFYLGTADEANESLTAVLDGFVARAITIRDFIADSGTEYAKRPNVSNDLREQLAAAIEESASAATGEQKMALIKRMSELFAKVYSCRMAYIDMLKTAETIVDLAAKLNRRGLLSEEEYNAVVSATNEVWDEYINGNVSEEQARERIRALEKVYGEMSLPVDEAGFYHLSEPRHLIIFSALVNEGEITAKAVVDADIDMSEAGDFTPIGFTSANGSAFQGLFDGQGHTISNVTINVDGANTNHVGFVGLLFTGTIRNLCLKDVTINNSSSSPVARGALVGRDGSGTIENCCVVNFTFNDQPVVETSTTAAGGVVGYLSSSATSVFQNNYAYHAIHTIEGTSAPLPSYGGKGSAAVNVRNNYDGVRTTDDQFASGEITYLLNGSQSDMPVWYQTLGEDPYPMLNATSKVVYKLDDGTYSNSDNPVEPTAPEADLLDVVFHEDGTAEDVSPMHNTVELCGTTSSTYYNQTYQRYTARFENPWGKTCTGYYKVDFESNEAIRSALADGHTLEMLVMGDYEGAIEDVEAKPFSAMQGGGTGFLICKTNSEGRQNEFTFLPNVTTTGNSTWRWTNSGVVPQAKTYYHVIGVWNKEESRAYIYVNGELRNTVDASGDFRFANAGCNWFCIGGDADPNGGGQGWAGDVVIARAYDKAITRGEAAALWNKLNEEPGIGIISPAAQPSAPIGIFRLDGVRVDKAQHGVYIIDGKKKMVK